MISSLIEIKYWCVRFANHGDGWNSPVACASLCAQGHSEQLKPCAPLTHSRVGSAVQQIKASIAKGSLFDMATASVKSKDAKRR